MQRVIQEYVPGKQMTIAHVIASPDEEIYQLLGVASEHNDAIGIATITPSEVAIIAVDVATKSAAVEIGYLDRFTGSLVITGDVSAVKEALDAVADMLHRELGFDKAEVSVT